MGTLFCMHTAADAPHPEWLKPKPLLNAKMELKRIFLDTSRAATCFGAKISPESNRIKQTDKNSAKYDYSAAKDYYYH